MSADDCPPHWVEAHLREIVHKLVDGSHNPPPKQGAGLPMLSAINIDGNTINFSESYRFITKAAFDEEDRRTSISPGDVLLTIVGAIGRAAIVPTTSPKFTIQRSVAVLSPILIDSKFLMYQLEAPRCSRYLRDNARGTAQKGIYLRTLGEAPIWIAPLNEQRRIVAKIEELFSELDKGVESLTTAREQLKAYREALLSQAVSGDLLASRGHGDNAFDGSVWKPLSTVIFDLGQGWSPRCLNHPSASDDIWAVITTTAIQHGAFFDRENKQLPDHLEPRPHLSVSPGDILVTRAGPRKRVGVACLVRRTRPRLMLCDKAYRLSVDESQVMPEWLELVLNAPKVLRDIEQLKTGISDSGVNLTQDRFLALKVSIPPRELQQKTLSIVDAIMSKITNMESQLETSLMQVGSLRQAILKDAFFGQLVPQDPTDEPASVLLELIRAGQEGMKKRRNNKNSKNKEAA